MEKTLYHTKSNQLSLPGMSQDAPQHTTAPAPVPGRRETSQEAARSIADVAPNQRMRIFEFVARQGTKGATRDEIGLALELKSQSVTPRVKELVRQGLLIETDQRRPTQSGCPAIVLVAAKKGSNDGAN